MTYVPKISYNDMYLYVYMYTHYDIIYIYIYHCMTVRVALLRVRFNDSTIASSLGALESPRLQVFGHIWIRAVTRHTAKAGIGCRKIWVFKDALARVLLRNTLEVHQFRKCRNDLRRRENPLLMHEIFMCHHHLSFKFFRFATSSPHESNSRSRCSTRSRCQCGQTV